MPDCAACRLSGPVRWPPSRKATATGRLPESASVGVQRLAPRERASRTARRGPRKAIACALDREQIWTSVPEEYELYELPPTLLNQTAVDEGVVDVEGYDNYDTDLDRATELMEEAGYQLDDGMWYDEDGDPRNGNDAPTTCRVGATSRPRQLPRCRPQRDNHRARTGSSPRRTRGAWVRRLAVG